MAISFELALNDLFKIDSSIADLDAAVDQKYINISNTSRIHIDIFIERKQSLHKHQN